MRTLFNSIMLVVGFLLSSLEYIKLLPSGLKFLLKDEPLALKGSPCMLFAAFPLVHFIFVLCVCVCVCVCVLILFLNFTKLY